MCYQNESDEFGENVLEELTENFDSILKIEALLIYFVLYSKSIFLFMGKMQEICANISTATGTKSDIHISILTQKSFIELSKC
jgi:hypothetical protein